MDIVRMVQRLYAAFGRGDIETIVRACDPDVVWISNADPALLPFGGEHRGPEGVRSFFRELAASLDTDSYEPLQFFGGPDSVTVLGRSISRSKRTGDPFEEDWIHLFRIKNGKMTEFRLFHDTHALVQAHFGGDVHAVTIPASETGEPVQH